MSTIAFIFNILCQVTTYIGKYALNLFTISDLSVTIKSESLKYLGNDLFVLCLDSISFIIFHELFIKFKIIKAFVII